MQAYSAALTTMAGSAGLVSIAALGTAADRMLYTTGANTFAEATITGFARNILDDADAATARGTLGLGTLATVSPTGTADGTTRLAGDGTWKPAHVSRAWSSPSRTVTVVYQNTAPHDMVLLIHWSAAGTADVQISANGSSGWITLDLNNTVSAPASATVVVPPGWYYRTTGAAVAIWREYV